MVTNRTILINWNRVDFVCEAKSPYGESYREIQVGKHTLSTLETIKKIEEKTSQVNSYVNLAKGVYDELGV